MCPSWCEEFQLRYLWRHSRQISDPLPVRRALKLKHHETMSVVTKHEKTFFRISIQLKIKKRWRSRSIKQRDALAGVYHPEGSSRFMLQKLKPRSITFFTFFTFFFTFLPLYVFVLIFSKSDLGECENVFH